MKKYNGRIIVEERFLSGLTVRSISAILFAALAFIPVTTYTFLVLGSTGFGGAAVFITTLLFCELLRLSFHPLRMEEVLIVYYGAGVGGTLATLYYLIIYRCYFVHSPFAWSATINGKPLATLVPSWLAPPINSPAYEMRNLYHSAFLAPVAIYTVSLILSLIADLALAMIISRVCVEVEKYEFPFAQVDLSMIKFISEKSPELTRLIIFSMIPGIVWASAIYFGPMVLRIQLIPVPFIDLTPYIQYFLPGAAIGLSSYLISYVSGFIIPFVSACYLVVASFFVWGIFNSLFITSLPELFPEWSKEYFLGMGLVMVQNRSFVRVWITPQIGFALAGAVFIGYKARRGLIAVFRGLFKRAKTESVLGFPRISILLIMFLVSTSALVIIHHYLLPDIPLWAPVFYCMFYTFFIAVLSTAMQGETGYAIVPTFTWQTIIYLTPYQGYAGFVHFPIYNQNISPTFAQQVKVALATRTKPIDLVKLHILIGVISCVVSFIILNIFWSMGPIPSSVYPFTVINMPLIAQIDVITATRQIKVSVPYILGPMGALLIVSLVGEFLLKFGIPFSHIGVFMGLFMQLPQSIALFIGSCIGKFIMPRLFKGQEWNRNKAVIVAGEMLGEGLILLLLTSIALLSRASWLKVW